MAEADSFDNWLADFSKEVDAALHHSTDAARATPEGRHAREAFDRWWQHDQKSALEPSPRFDSAEAALAPAAGAPPVTQAAPSLAAPERGSEPFSRLDRLAEERAQFQRERDAAQSEARALNEKLASVQGQIAEFEARLSKSRQAYEDHIQQLEGQLRELQEKGKAQQAAEALASQAEQQRQAALEQASRERERAETAERQLLEARQRREGFDKQLLEARQEIASQAGVIDELRRQASTYQLRLVQSKEATDSDVMNMRTELKTFLEDLRMIRNSLRKGE